MKQLAITLRLLQQKLHDSGMGNESAIVARMARDAETIQHVNIAEATKFEKPESQPGDIDFDGTPATAAKRAKKEDKDVDRS